MFGMITPDRIRSMLAAIAALLVLSFVPVATAHAGLPSMGSLKAKLTGKKTPEATDDTGAAGSNGGKVTYNDVVIEITDARLDGFIAGLKAGRDVMQGHDELVTRRGDLQDQISAIMDKDGKAVDASRDAMQKVRQCRDQEYRDMEHEHSQKLQQQMMSDPAAREKLIRQSQEMSMAQSKGDTATVARIQREIGATAGLSKADSLEAEKQCDPMPKPHPSAAKVEALEHELSAADRSIRSMEQKALPAEAQASGLTESQFAMMRERVEMFLAVPENKPVPRGFSESELKALASHRAALKAAL